MMLVMARYRRALALRPVTRIKHVVDSQDAVPLNTQVTKTIANAVDAPVLANANQVETGSVIRSFFISVEIVASADSTTATPNFYLIFFKDPGNNLTFPNGNVVGSDDNKKYVFHQEMVMFTSVDGGNPRNVFKGVLKVPKHMQRMVPNDRISFQYFIPSTGVTVNACSQVHYKELR